jgi:hypothetical protein
MNSYSPGFSGTISTGTVMRLDLPVFSSHPESNL